MANKVSDWAADLAAGLVGILLLALVVGLLVYLVAVFVAYAFAPSLSGLKAAMGQKEAFNIGLPCAGLGAFGVVAALLHAFPPQKAAGSVKIKLFGLEFTGPAGPITLWVVCFLSIVGAMRILS